MENETPTQEENQNAPPEVEQDQASERPGEVERTGSKPGGSEANGRENKGGPDPYYANKRVTEKLLARMDKQDALMAKLLESRQPAAAAPSPASNAEKEPVDIWTDPDKYLDKKLDERMSRLELGRAREEAEQFVLSQEGIDPEKDYDALQSLSKEHRLDLVAREDPMRAAQTLVALWKSQKGTAEDRTSEKARAASVQGGRTRNGAPVFSGAEIRRLAVENPDEYEKRRGEFVTAAKEGRIKP